MHPFWETSDYFQVKNLLLLQFVNHPLKRGAISSFYQAFSKELSSVQLQQEH